MSYLFSFPSSSPDHVLPIPFSFISFSFCPCLTLSFLLSLFLSLPYLFLSPSFLLFGPLLALPIPLPFLLAIPFQYHSPSLSTPLSPTTGLLIPHSSFSFHYLSMFYSFSSNSLTPVPFLPIPLPVFLHSTTVYVLSIPSSFPPLSLSYLNPSFSYPSSSSPNSCTFPN